MVPKAINQFISFPSFVCFDSLCPSHQLSSHVGTQSCPYYYTCSSYMVKVLNLCMLGNFSYFFVVC